MRASFIAAINQICGEKNVAPDQVLEAVKQAIATAWRKDYGNKEQEVRVVLREDQDMPSILIVKEVVEEVENENLEISINDAAKLKPDAKEGDEIEIDVDLEDGRIAAIRFTGNGCAVSQAAASMLTELVDGMPAAEAAVLPSQAIMDELGIPLSAMRVKCAVLGLGTLKVALHRGAGTPLPEEWGVDDEMVWD